MKRPSTADDKPDRKSLGPTGPAKMPPDSDQSHADKHPNPGNIDDPLTGPTPTDDPRGKAGQLENEIDKKRAQTPPD